MSSVEEKEIEEFLNIKRAELINKIEKDLGVNFIGYVMNPIGTMVDLLDADALYTFLSKSPSQKYDNNKPILLMLYTTGGLMEISIKIIDCLNYYSNNNFKVCLPGIAKSAGTILCLGAQEIMMGLVSEIGPIDTQIRFDGVQFSALDYVASNKKIMSEIKELNEADPPYDEQTHDDLLGALYLQLDKIDVVWLQECERANVRVHKISIDLMEKNEVYNSSDSDADKEKIAKITKKLVYEYDDHGDVINFEKAKELGLKVSFYEPTNSTWETIKELYSRIQNLMLNQDFAKIIFNDEQYLILESNE